MDSVRIDQPAFGERLRGLRTARGLSQRDLAGGVVNPSYISLIESGARVPTLDVALQLAEILDVPLEELVDGTVGGQHAPAASMPAAPGIRASRATATTAAATEAGTASSASAVRSASPGASGAESDRLVHELLAEGARETGDLDDAQLRFRSAYDASRARDNAVSAVENGWALLDVLGRLDDLAARLTLSAELVELAGGLGSIEVSIRTWIDRAAALRDSGDLGGARDMIDRACGAVDGTALANTGEHVRLLGVAISISAESGEIGDVPATVTSMLDVAAKVSSDAVLGRALWVAGLAHGRMGDADAASASMSRAARILSNPATSLRDWIRFSLAAGTALLDSDGDAETVRRHLDTAHIAMSLVDLPAEAAVLRLQQARLLVRDGRAGDALDLLDSVSNDDLGPGDAAVGWSVRAHALEGLGRTDDAVVALRRAVELCEQAGAYRLAAAHWRAIDRLRSA